MTNKFTSRHYEALAGLFQETCPVGPGETATNAETYARLVQWDLLRLRSAQLFRADNNRFKFDRYLAACAPGADIKVKTNYTPYHIPRFEGPTATRGYSRPALVGGDNGTP